MPVSAASRPAGFRLEAEFCSLRRTLPARFGALVESIGFCPKYSPCLEPER